ncbi:MAG: hypothetical protein KKD59_01635, partial [Acidobacteria bacterium]|nr:hypothetical protein [Acidobacteriota bacterium]
MDAPFAERLDTQSLVRDKRLRLARVSFSQVCPGSVRLGGRTGIDVTDRPGGKGAFVDSNVFCRSYDPHNSSGAGAVGMALDELLAFCRQRRLQPNRIKYIFCRGSTEL